MDATSPLSLFIDRFFATREPRRERVVQQSRTLAPGSGSLHLYDQ